MPLVDTVRERNVDHVCVCCGYGVAVSTPPPICPMCRGTQWDRPLWHPFTSLDEYRARFEPSSADEYMAKEALAL